ncbi:MAG: hypothetical protein ACRCXD_12745 [Luteolibacter sp.]
MTTTATLADDLKLHEGEEFVLRAVAKNGALIVTSVLRTAPDPLPGKPSRKTNFTAKWAGTMTKVTDADDLLLSHINEKHVK